MTLVREIINVNPHDITPNECAAWLAHLHTLCSTGVERVETDEVQHTLIAVHPGTDRTETVTVYIKQT